MNSGWKLTLGIAAMAFLLGGCTTTAAKKAMYKKQKTEAYTGFDADATEESKRTVEKIEPIKDDADPEVAVNKLVEYLQKERSYAIPAEEQLKIWGRKQGVDKMIVNKVRPLLKNERVEVRAPALRLTLAFGKDDVVADLIECLADEEYAVRATAIKALKARTQLDFGYQPAGGEVARQESVDEWRQWWQVEQHKVAVKPATIYEGKQPRSPKVTAPGRNENLDEDEDISRAFEAQPSTRNAKKSSRDSDSE